MSQLSLPLGGCETPAGTQELETVSPIAGKLIPNRAAEKCRASANALEKQITVRHDSANRLLAQPPTRKRLQEADRHRREAIRLERIQRTLRTLADMHQAGDISLDLAALTSRAAIERALFSELATSRISEIYKQTECAESREQKALRLSREAMLIGIPGFFPTPAETARRLVAFARLTSPGAVLEPSAGSGCLVDAIRTQYPEAAISYCEINCFLLDVLRAKYEGTANVHFVGRDFLELDPIHFKTRFPGIILNPPFERGEDIEHVLHAFRFLTSRGVLAAILSEGTFSRNDKKAKTFRTFLETVNVEMANLPPDAFKTSGTAARCRMLRITARS